MSDGWWCKFNDVCDGEECVIKMSAVCIAYTMIMNVTDST